MPDPAISIRSARPEDLDALVALEQACFEGDRLSRRSLRWMLSRGNADLRVAEPSPGAASPGGLAGYLLVCFHRGTALARLYSIAVAPAARGAGLGKRLLAVAETAARERDCLHLRLEVRRDNVEAIGLYRSLGYYAFGEIPRYYEDGADALRLEKRISPAAPTASLDVPYFRQTTGFTCGPAALMMAMATLDPAYDATEAEELRLWREATTIFMTSGHGGCGPHGLALAALERGFSVELFLNQEGPLFLDGVRNESKKRILERVHRDFAERVAAAGIPVRSEVPAAARLRTAIEAGAVPVCLISSYRLYGEKSPHWVTVTGASERFIFIHDSSLDPKAHQTETDRMHIPIRADAFDKMARFGRSGLRAAVVLSKRPGK